MDNKFLLHITPDQSVIEVQSDPLSVKDWKKYEDLLQKVVFDGLETIDLVPHEREGAGHVNVGTKELTPFKNLMTHFILDFLSKPGVGTALNSETSNGDDAQGIIDYAAWELNLHEKGSQITPKILAKKNMVAIVQRISAAARSFDESDPLGNNMT